MIRKIVLMPMLAVIGLMLSAPASVQTGPVAGEPVRLFPRDVLGYIGIHDIPDGLAQSRKLMERWFGKEETAKLAGTIKDLLKQGLDQMPAAIRPHAVLAARGMKSLHFVALDVRKNHLQLALLVEFSGEKIFPELLAALKSYLDDPVAVEKTRVYRVTDSGRGESPNVYLAAFGPYGLLSLDTDTVREVLQRHHRPAEFKTSLADHPTLKDIRPSSPGFSMALFVDIENLLRRVTETLGRSGRFEYDRIDAALKFSGARTWTYTSRFDPSGDLTSDGKIVFDPACALWDLMRQTPSEKKLLEFIPANAMLYGGYTVTDPAATWKKIKAMIVEHERNFSLEEGEFEKNLKWAEEDAGMSFDELCNVFGGEVAFYVDSLPIMALGMGAMPKAAYVFQLKSREAGEKAWEKLVKTSPEFTRGSWKKEEYQGFTLQYQPPSKDSGMGGQPQFAYTFIENRFVLGLTKAAVRQVIDTHQKGTSMAKDKEVQKFLAKVPAKNVGITVINTKKIYQLMEQVFGLAGMAGAGGLPPGFQLPSSEKMPETLLDVAVTVDGGNEWSFKASGAGGMSMYCVLVAPMLAFALPVMLYSRPTPGDEGEGAEPRVSGAENVPDLPGDKAEAKKILDRLIGDLGSTALKERQEASRQLKVLGERESSRPLVVPAVIDLVKMKNPEVRQRAREILIYLREFSVMPELVEEKVRGILADLDVADEWRVQQWSSADSEGGYGMEPDSSDRGGLFSVRYLSYARPRASDRIVLETENGIKEVGRSLLDPSSSAHLKRNVAYLLTRIDSHALAEALLKVIETESDSSVRLFSIIALGWSREAEVRSKIQELLQGERAEQRAAFLAIERSTDPRWVDDLLKLLAHDDDETRFNAGYTLEKLVGPIPSARFNAFESKERRAAAVRGIEEWWKTNKATFKIQKKKYEY